MNKIPLKHQNDQNAHENQFLVVLKFWKYFGHFNDFKGILAILVIF